MNRYLAAILCIIVLMFILETHARAETWLVGSGVSYHFRDSDNHNQRNWGIGFEHDLAYRVRLVAGEYENSLYRTSLYSGIAWTPWRASDFYFGITGGIVTGYDTKYAAVPLIVPTVNWERNFLGANLFAAPHVKDAPGVIGLQVKFKF